MFRLSSSLALVLSLVLVLPALAADHAYVADGALAVIGADGERSRNLELPAPAATIFDRSGERLLVGVETAALPRSGDVLAGGLDLWLVDTDRGTRERLTSGERVVRAAWAPDGARFAYATIDSRLFVVDPATGERRLISEGAIAPAFSPDGTRLAYSRTPDGWTPGSQPAEGFALTVLDLASGEETALTRGHDDAEPIWTPDGRELLFVSGSRTGLVSMYKVSADGGEVVQLTNRGVESAASPSFVRNPTRNVDASWSPDGARLLYGAHYSEAGEVMVVDFDASYRAREARLLGQGRDPSWTADGAVLVPYSGEGVPTPALEIAADAAVERIDLDREPVPAETARAPVADLDAIFDGLDNEVAAACTNARFRWPVSWHPGGNYYYYDNDNGGGQLNWKCSSSETYNQHRGTDIPVGCGNYIYAGAAGNVDWRNDGCANYGYWGNNCGWGFGNFVRIDHGNGWKTIYAHMQSGTPYGYGYVGCGWNIGLSCSSGNSTGPHLHFEVNKYGHPWDDPFSGSCSGPESYWCSQNGDGWGRPSRSCCCT